MARRASSGLFGLLREVRGGFIAGTGKAGAYRVGGWDVGAGGEVQAGREGKSY